MSVWEDYSPDFEDAYRRFERRLDDDDVFNDWVNKFDKWINESRISKGLPPIQPTLKQIRALAYFAYDEGKEDLSVQVLVPDRRYKTGFRVGYRDVNTLKITKDPYKERERRNNE